MGKNAYLEKQRQRDEAFFEAGRETGLQQMWDCVQLALREPDAVGKDIFGRDRLKRLYINGIQPIYRKYGKAHTVDKEADYDQQKLDDELQKIWLDEFVPYAERYEHIRQRGYGTKKGR